MGWPRVTRRGNTGCIRTCIHPPALLVVVSCTRRGTVLFLLHVCGCKSYLNNTFICIFDTLSYRFETIRFEKKKRQICAEHVSNRVILLEMIRANLNLPMTLQTHPGAVRGRGPGVGSAGNAFLTGKMGALFMAHHVNLASRQLNFLLNFEMGKTKRKQGNAKKKKSRRNESLSPEPSESETTNSDESAADDDDRPSKKCKRRPQSDPKGGGSLSLSEKGPTYSEILDRLQYLERQNKNNPPPKPSSVIEVDANPAAYLANKQVRADGSTYAPSRDGKNSGNVPLKRNKARLTLLDTRRRLVGRHAPSPDKRPPTYPARMQVTRSPDQGGLDPNRKGSAQGAAIDAILDVRVPCLC
jgi:hypothetical protein